MTVVIHAGDHNESLLAHCFPTPRLCITSKASGRFPPTIGDMAWTCRSSLLAPVKLATLPAQLFSVEMNLPANVEAEIDYRLGPETVPTIAPECRAHDSNRFAWLCKTSMSRKHRRGAEHGFGLIQLPTAATIYRLASRHATVLLRTPFVPACPFVTDCWGIPEGFSSTPLYDQVRASQSSVDAGLKSQRLRRS